MPSHVHIEFPFVLLILCYTVQEKNPLCLIIFAKGNQCNVFKYFITFAQQKAIWALVLKCNKHCFPLTVFVTQVIFYKYLRMWNVFRDFNSLDIHLIWCHRDVFFKGNCYNERSSECMFRERKWISQSREHLCTHWQHYTPICQVH